MGRYIVMDIVFYGNSLNYDQGTGNYQELKKITKWDGRQYTLVSRYALRYSLLETAKKMGLWDIADGSKLQRAGDGNQTVIQPSDEILLSGEILKYPEFDLFGYLITSTTPQNFRTAPVKISHAVSLTPFSYDALFNANIGLANRMRKITGGMEPNPFTAEEHETYYQYTVIIDIENIGKLDVYINRNSNVGTGKEKWKIDEIHNGDKLKFILKKDKGKESKTIEQSDSVKKVVFEELEKDLVRVLYSLRPKDSEDPVEERIIRLVRAILHLKRSIKGREEDLSPKLVVVGLYKNNPYKTYKDRISLVDEYYEEEYDEVTEEPLENGRKIKIKHVVSKSKKPLFEVKVNSAEKTELSENELINFVNGVFDKKKDSINQIRVFYDPSIECEIK